MVMRRDLWLIVLIREDLYLQRQHFLLSYFKTLSVGPGGVELATSRMTTRCSTNWAIRCRIPSTLWYLHQLATFPNILQTFLSQSQAHRWIGTTFTDPIFQILPISPFGPWYISTKSISFSLHQTPAGSGILIFQHFSSLFLTSALSSLFSSSMLSY